MGLRPRLLRLSGWTWAAAEGSCDWRACLQGISLAVQERLPLAPSEGHRVHSPGTRPFGGSSDCRASPGVCPAPAVVKTPGLATQEAATQ